MNGLGLEYFDREGHPVSMDEYIRLSAEPEYKRVAWDELPGGGYISTIWLGLNHAYDGRPPLIFETMAFPVERWSYTQERYSTIDEARTGHAEILARLTEATP